MMIYGKFLQDSQDVVLDFPFKDSVLTASMTKDDENGYDDAFLNEVIEKDEIDQLFNDKAFQKVKRYDPNGENVNTAFDIDNDNLMIKGNNLLALHSLLDNYAGKVKLIYIDIKTTQSIQIHKLLEKAIIREFLSLWLEKLFYFTMNFINEIQA